MDIESTIRSIVREELAAADLSASADPVLLEPKDVYQNKGYKISETLLRDLIKNAEKYDFPVVRLGKRTTLIDKRRLNAWLASGGLGVNV